MLCPKCKTEMKAKKESYTTFSNGEYKEKPYTVYTCPECEYKVSWVNES